MKRRTRVPLMAILLFALFSGLKVGSAQTSEEAAGQAAAQSGKLREAVTHYVAALQVASEGSDGEQRLREKIISLVVKLDPPPVLPDEAVRYEGRAEAAVKNARVPADFLEAANEYKKALRLAPWMSNYYYNLGLVLEKAERREESIRSLKLYLLAAPSDRDATKVRKKIAGLEYELEKQARDRAESEERERRRKEAERQEQVRYAAFDSLVGTWSVQWRCPDCSNDSGWHVVKDADVARVLRRGSEIHVYLANDPAGRPFIKGEIEGTRLESIKWTTWVNRPPDCTNFTASYYTVTEFSNSDDWRILFFHRPTAEVRNYSCSLNRNDRISWCRLMR